MTPRAITVLIGHPDPAPDRFNRQLAAAYVAGARAAGHTVQVFDLAQMAFPILRTQTDFLSDVPASPDVEAFQAAIQDSAHLAIFFPLWMGGMPALLKALFEQTCRGAFAFDETRSPFARKLKGRSLRVVVTMGMPMLAFRLYFLAHGLKVLERNILGFIGFGPIRDTVIGSVDTLGEAGRARWLERIGTLGTDGA